MINQLIEILYHPNGKLSQDPEFYHRVIDEIESSAVSSQAFYLLKRQRQLENTPLFFRMRLEKKYSAALYQNLFIKSQLDQLLRKFESTQIKVIPIKGVYFAERYFGHIGARCTSDIDLLIKKENIQQAIHCVKSMGFELEEEPIPAHFHLSFSKRLPQSSLPLTVEIHWNILKESTSNFQIASFWQGATPFKDYKYVMELSDYHTFYLICLHGWRHNLDSSKYFIDIIQMIYVLKVRLDYDRMFKEASAHQTLKRLVRTLTIVYTVYPMLTEIIEIPIKRKFLYKAGLGHQNKFTRYWDFVDYQLLSYDSFQHSLREAYSWLITGGCIKAAKAAYAILVNRPR